MSYGRSAGGHRRRVAPLSKLGAEGADNVIELCILGCYSSASELRFDLRKLDFWVNGQERWQLDADGCEARGGSREYIGLGHVGVRCLLIVAVTDVVPGKVIH